MVIRVVHLELVPLTQSPLLGLKATKDTQCQFVVDTGIFSAGVYIFLDSSFQSQTFWEGRV